MDNTQVEVTSASLLEKLADLFFRGLGSIFDYAAEYEDDYGKLKSVTRIPVKDESGEDFTLVVKLSPIKDKEGMFYIELELQDSNKSKVSSFKGDPLNEKTIKLDKSNKASLDKELDKVLAKNKLVKVDPEDASENSQQEDEASEENGDIDEFDAVGIKDPNRKIHVICTRHPVEGQADKYTLTIETDKHVDKPFSQETAMTADKVDERIQEWLEWNDLMREEDSEEEDTDSDETIDLSDEDLEEALNEDINETAASSKIRVTLRKVTSAKEPYADLIAISASTPSLAPAAALNMLRAVVSDDEFFDQLDETDQSFEITDEGEDYDVQEIAEVDTSDTIQQIFSAVWGLMQVAQKIHWSVNMEDNPSLDVIATDIQWRTRDILETTGRWLTVQNDKCPNFTSQDIDIKISTPPEEKISTLKDVLTGFIELLDLLYVNIDADKQPVISTWINDLKDINARMTV